MLCNPPLSEIQEKFQHPKQETSFSLRSHSSFSPAPVSWKLQIHFLSEWLCLFWTFYINRNIQVDSSLCSKVNVWCNLWAVSIYCFPPFCSWDMLSCLFVYIVVFCWKVNTFTMIMSNLGKWHLCQFSPLLRFLVATLAIAITYLCEFSQWILFKECSLSFIATNVLV